MVVQFFLKIKVPAGTKGIYVDFLSNRKNEQEVLLPRGIRLAVEGVQKFFKKNVTVTCDII